jgi:hypothetical protein
MNVFFANDGRLPVRCYFKRYNVSWNQVSKVSHATTVTEHTLRRSSYIRNDNSRYDVSWKRLSIRTYVGTTSCNVQLAKISFVYGITFAMTTAFQFRRYNVAIENMSETDLLQTVISSLAFVYAMRSIVS